MIVTDLRVHHLTEPLGFAVYPPEFSWKVKETEDAKRQVWARICIYKGTVCLYDSGCDETASSLGTVANIALEPRTAYRWSVEVAADTGETARAESRIETGKMDESWQGQWITSTLAKQDLPVLKKEFMAEAVHTGRLYICCTGQYEVWLNGEKAGNEYLASGRTLQNMFEVHTYDVSSLLKEGKNTLLLWLGQADSQVCCELYGDKGLLVCTEESWVCAASPIMYSAGVHGEMYDARKAVKLENGENWRKCEKISREAEGQKEISTTATDQKMRILTDRYSLPVCCREILGQTLLTTSKKEKVFDFGQYMTGWAEFENKMPAGMMVRLTVGTLHNGCFFEKEKSTQFVYVSSGQREHVRPYFSVYRFRYMKIEVFEPDGTPSEQVISNILTEWKGVHLRRDVEQTVTVRTGVEYVNRLFLNAVWSWKNAMLDMGETEKKLSAINKCEENRCAPVEKKFAENAMELLLNEEYPGWLYGVRKGTTTLLDDWDIVTADGQLRKEETDELRRSGYEQVEVWLYAYVCGICPSQSNAKQLRIEPHPDTRLGFASARLETAAGTVKSAWKYNPDHTIIYKVQIPFDTEADIILPDETLHIFAGYYVIRK